MSLLSAVIACAVLAAPATLEVALTRATLPEDVSRAEVQRYLHARVPPLVVPESQAAWEQQAEALRARYLDEVVLKGVPEAWTEGEVKIEWVADIETGKGYRIRKLRYEVLPGMWNPAWLYEPDGDTTGLPTVLNVNGHYAEGMLRPEEQTRCINLAKRGVLNLHPEWIGMGELGGVEYAHDRTAYLDATGMAGVSVFYLSLSRALDVLTSHPRADASRVAMTGLSGGGWQTTFLSALDERVSVIVPVAGHGAMAVRIQNSADIGDIEQVPSDMLTVADYTHLTALFAPRPSLLIYNAQDECCFQAERTLPAIYDPVRPVYDLYGAGAVFDFHINEDPGTHNYDLDNRLQFYDFLDQHLVTEASWDKAELPVEGEILDAEGLQVGVPENNVTVVSLALERARAIQRPAPPAEGDALRQWRVERRAVLADLLSYDPVNLHTVSVDLASEGDALSAAYAFKSADWTIPAAGFFPQAAPEGGVHIFLDDGGFEKAAATAKALLNEGKNVVAVAPFGHAGNRVNGGGVWQYSMIINATGERALAVQAAQVAAVCDWFRTARGVRAITLHTRGTESGLIGLTVAALHPGLVDGVETTEMPASLIDVMEARGKYSETPSLYSFGFLREFDFDMLRVMWSPERD